MGLDGLGVVLEVTVLLGGGVAHAAKIPLGGINGKAEVHPWGWNPSSRLRPCAAPAPRSVYCRR
ncbi:hypothetical protein GCM10011376_04810 [Nocardioides flavus (ex Wang et al. 2016)]|uniref:Uncharacterized protein n=1 Tax=Nocardioides flavus (ex Wang et al. 2016) TaxID=2058780 RepID=A0ABQ3HGG8_9ACTN|nr:hypothetical protein GCM10011376_04810 [Nocardioides flavus (ex Wang et al. 2016)]